MDFDAESHLKTSLRLAGVIKRIIEPIAGVYEDREHPRGVTGDTTFEIDVPVENAVQDFFASLDMPVKVLTEDRGEILHGARPEAIYLIDPLDGSRNARRGLPVYSCSIAVFPPDAKSLDDALVGVVSRLDGQEDFTVIASEGAYRNGKRIKASGKEDLTNAVINVGCHLSAGYVAHTDFMNALASDVGYNVDDVWVKCYGSTALELAYLAAGCVDLQVDLRAGMGLDATPKTYDVAAALLLCRESGAKVIYGSSMIPEMLPIDPSVRVQLIAAGSGKLLNRATKYL